MRRVPLTAVIQSVLTLVAMTIVLAFGGGAARGQVAPPPLPVDPGPVIPPVPQQLVVNVGDTIQVAGAEVGCQVTDRDGRPTIECRRTTGLKGSYGTFIDERKATVARYVSGGKAQVIFTGKHSGAWRVCGARARASRAGAGGCR
jgi:hypothetical protein